MDHKKNFLILLSNIAITSYLLAGLPKIFGILSPIFSQVFNLTMPAFDSYIYNATFYSLGAKILFSFLIHHKNFDKYFSIYTLFILSTFLHSVSILACLIPHLSIHVIARFTQGFAAGSLQVLLEPIILNCSDPQWRNKLLYFKYELIALLTPVSILVLSLTNNYWQWTLIVLSLLALIIGLSIIGCKVIDNQYVHKENQLINLKTFYKSLKYGPILINNIIIGVILGLFLVLIQNHFYHEIKLSNKLLKGLIQGLPFTLSFIIAKLPYRFFWQKFFLGLINGIGLGLGGLLLINNTMNLWIKFLLIGLIILLYIVYVLWTPYLLTNTLNNKPEDLSHRSISIASQLIRSLSTLFICNLLNGIYKKQLLYNYKNQWIYFNIIIFLVVIYSKTLWKPSHKYLDLFLISLPLISLIIFYGYI